MINKIKSLFAPVREPHSEIAYKWLFEQTALKDEAAGETLRIIIWLPGTPNLADLKEKILIELALIIRLMLYFEVKNNMRGSTKLGKIKDFTTVINTGWWLREALSIPSSISMNAPVMIRIRESYDLDFGPLGRLEILESWTKYGELAHTLEIDYGLEVKSIGAAYYYLAQKSLEEVCPTLKDSPRWREIVGRWAPWFKSWHYRVREFCSELEKRYPNNCHYELVNTFDKKNSSQ